MGGIQRKPGGWRLPITNMVMGPPIFAPLLFGVAAYLGLLASFLRRADSSPALRIGRRQDIQGDIREGRFQQQLAFATAISAFFSGFEAWYSHYKNNFRYKAQWTPVIVAPMLMAAGFGAMKSKRVAHTWLPAISALARAAGGAGLFYHPRGGRRLRALAEWGLTRMSRSSLWDADHIVPVVEGGGECDLSNIRTLCLKCHRTATAALRQRRPPA